MIFCADGGGTKTDAVLLADDGAELFRTRAGPCNFWRDPDRAADALRQVWRDTGHRPNGVRACIAAAGLSAQGAVERVRAVLPGFEALHIVSDGYAALASAFGNAPGALIVVGTGVAGIARDANGGVRSASGWGFPAGDRGGGAWLGFSLVQSWLERLDGYPHPESDLWQAVASRAGGGRSAVLDWLKRASPTDFADLAPAIVAAGDATADQLLKNAAAHIQNLAACLLPPRWWGRAGVGGTSDATLALADGPPPPSPLPQEGERRLAMSGGLAHVMAPCLTGYDILLDIDPLLGCARIARGEVDPHDPTIT